MVIIKYDKRQLSLLFDLFGVYKIRDAFKDEGRCAFFDWGRLST
jgi:hypothetical protein